VKIANIGVAGRREYLASAYHVYKNNGEEGKEEKKNMLKERKGISASIESRKKEKERYQHRRKHHTA